MGKVIQFKPLRKRKFIFEKLLPELEEFVEEEQMNRFVIECITLITRQINNGKYGQGYHGMSLADIQVMPYQESKIWILGNEYKMKNASFLNEIDVSELVKKLEFINRKFFKEGMVMRYSYTEYPRLFYITLI